MNPFAFAGGCMWLVSACLMSVTGDKRTTRGEAHAYLWASILFFVIGTALACQWIGGAR